MSPKQFLQNGRGPHYFRQWKTTSIFQTMEDDLNFSESGKRSEFSRKWKTIFFFTYSWASAKFHIILPNLILFCFYVDTRVSFSPSFITEQKLLKQMKAGQESVGEKLFNFTGNQKSNNSSNGPMFKWTLLFTFQTRVCAVGAVWLLS
jgi:hypothetical protein